MDTIEAQFETLLNQRGVSWQIAEDGRYQLDIDGQMCWVSLDNIRRDAQTDPDALVRFVDSVLAHQTNDLSDWASLRHTLRYALESAYYEGTFEGTIHRMLNDELVQVLVCSVDDGRRIVWVNTSMLDAWAISMEDAIAQAETNMIALAKATTCEVQEVKGFRLGMLSTQEMPFKASLVLSAGFQALVEPSLGWPVFVVAPCRDFIYVIPEADRDLLGYLGHVVVEEFTQSAYPITKDILHISNERIAIIGTYPD